MHLVQWSKTFIKLTYNPFIQNSCLRSRVVYVYTRCDVTCV